jgi:hypothetical protein
MRVPIMYVAQETTKWDEPCPNHTYVFTAKPDGRTATCIAYIKPGTDKVIKLKSPLKIDLRRRTFEEVK